MSEWRLALRRLRFRPGASIVSVVTLGCAIGAATATWTLISAVLLHPLPVRAPERVVEVDMRGDGDRTAQSQFLYTDFTAVRDAATFDGLAAGGMWTTMLGQGEAARYEAVAFVTHGFFDTLGVSLPMGRSFSAGDDQRGAPLVALLSDRYWHAGFEADPKVIGRTLVANGKTVTIIGVAPAGFRGLSLTSAPAVYMPLNQIGDIGPAPINFFAAPESASLASPMSWISIVGRMPSGADVATVAGRLQTLLQRPNARRKTTVELVPIDTAAVPEASRSGMRQFSRLLLGTVGLLLLIGCITVGTLLLIRTEARRDEFAMCLALGATRAQLARGVALEGGMLSIAGASTALPISLWLLAAVRTFQLPGGIDLDLLDLSLDRRALAVAVGCALAATLAIALVAGDVGR